MNLISMRQCGLLIVLLSCWSSACVHAQDFQIDRSRRSVVYIKSFIPNVGTGVGTGFLVDENGLIFTNRHVIESENRSHQDSLIIVGVPVHDDPDRLDYFRAEVVLVAEEPEARDFAILKIAAQPDYGVFHPLRLSERNLSLGEDIAVLGFPYINEGDPTVSLTRGVISSTRVQFDGISFYQTDAAINPGNSGGPLLQADGTVAGIVTLKLAGAENIGYALQLSEIREQITAAKSRLSAVHPQPGPIETEQMPDFAQLAAEDAAAGSGTEARTPEWAAAKPFEALNRIWTSADGNFRTEAIYVTSKDGEITLRKPTGAFIKVPRERLSELDQYYIRAMESPRKGEGKLPAPPLTVVAAKSKELREIFAADFQQPELPLFEKLLKLALETRSQDPAAAYACLWEASCVAAQAAQVELMFGVIAGLERWYEVEDRLLSLQTELLQIAEPVARTPEARAEIFVFSLLLIDFAEKRRDFESGHRLVALAGSAARRSRSAEWSKVLRRRTSRLEAFQAACKLADAARAHLQRVPDAAAARFAVGRFQVLFEQQWSVESLNHLAAGNDPRYAAAAKLELASPTTAKSRMLAGDAWWEIGEAETDEDNRQVLFSHAAQLYQRCIDELSALDRTKVEQRLALVADDSNEDGDAIAHAGQSSSGSARRYSLTSRSPWPPYLASSRALATRTGLHNLGNAFVHTNESNFLTQNFHFEALLTLGQDEGIAYVGMGELSNDHNRGESNNALRFRIHAPGRHRGELQIGHPQKNGEVVGRLAKPCQMRVSISKQGESVTMVIDVDDDGPTPDDIEFTIPDLRAAAPSLNSKNCFLFFGGGGTFSEVQLKRGRSTGSQHAAAPRSPAATGPDINARGLTPIATASRFLDFSTAMISRQAMEIRPRTAVSTKRADLLDRDFRFQLILTIPETTQRPPLERAAYVGIGGGTFDRGHEVQDSVRIAFSSLEQNFGDGAITLAKSGTNGMVDRDSEQILGRLSKPGTHRVLIEKRGPAVTFTIDVDNDGKTDDDLEITIPNLREYAPFLHTKNSRLFFCGNAHFTHVSLDILR